MSRKPKYRTSDVSGGNGASGARGERKVRRSITVVEKNHKSLLKARGEIMTILEVDADYTTALNFFLDLGLRKYFNRQLNREDIQTMISYLFDQNLREESELDTAIDWQTKALWKKAAILMSQNQQQ